MVEEDVDDWLQAFDAGKVSIAAFAHVLHEKLGLRLLDTQIQTCRHSSRPCLAPVEGWHEMHRGAGIDQSPLVLAQVQERVSARAEKVTELLRPLSAASSDIPP